MEFERQYNELKTHFKSKGFKTALQRLETIKNNPVSLLKLYNEYFRNPNTRKDLYMMREDKFRSVIKKYLLEVIKEEEFGETIGAFESIPTDDSIILEKFPPLREALFQLMGKDYKAFIKDVKYVAPKPSTFQIDMGDEEFNLIWVNKKVGFTCEVQGKNYFLNNLSEKQQAVKAVNSLLRIGSETPEEAEAVQGKESPNDISPSEIGGDSNFGTPISGDEFKEIPNEEPENTDIEVLDGEDEK